MCEHKLVQTSASDFLMNPIPYRYDTTNGESIAEIAIELMNSTTIPPAFYHPESSVMYHKPFGAIAIFCACLFVASFLCFGPCLIIRGCFAKRVCAPREHVKYILPCGFRGWCWSFVLQIILACTFFYFLTVMDFGLIGIIDGSFDTLLSLKSGFDCAFTWIHNTNDTAMHLFQGTYEFVDNEVVNITLNLDTLSHQLTSLQSNLTMTINQLNTGCDKLTNEYPLFSSSFDCQKIQADLNIDTLNADIDNARNTLQEINASIGGALNSARIEINQVELQVFDTVGSANTYLDNVYNSLFTQGDSVLPALPAIWLLLPKGLGPHAGLEEWMQAAKPVATAAATCLVLVVALPAIIGVFMLLGANIAMAMRRRNRGISKKYNQSISSANFPLLHDTDGYNATSRDSTEYSTDFLSIDGNRAHVASYRSTTSINDQLIDLNAGKPSCVCVCCARAGCCVMFATAGILFLMACIWFLVLGIFGSACDVALLPTAQDLPPGLLHIGDMLSSGSGINSSAVVQSCFSSTSLLPALGIDLSDQFALDTAPLLSQASPQMIADLSGPVMAEAVVALDEATAGLVENEVDPVQLEMLSQACQQCNITQWRLTLQSLGFDLPICGQTTCDNQPTASICQNQFCEGKQFGDDTDALINATLINVDSLRDQLTLLNVTLGLTEEFAAVLPLAVDGFISGVSAEANAISCSFVKNVYAQTADGLCHTAIDGYQTATNSILGAAMVLSVMVCVQILVNIRLGGVGSGPPPVRVRSEDVFAVPSRPSIQLSVKSDKKALSFRSDSQSTEDSEVEEQFDAE